jgi:MA3 domain
MLGCHARRAQSELCNMLTECCSQERSYLTYYGLIAQRFCMMQRRWQEAFEGARSRPGLAPAP